MAAPALLAPSVATSAAAAASAVWLSLRAFGYTDAIVATRSAALGAQAAGRSAGSRLIQWASDNIYLSESMDAFDEILGRVLRDTELAPWDAKREQLMGGVLKRLDDLISIMPEPPLKGFPPHTRPIRRMCHTPHSPVSHAPFVACVTLPTVPSHTPHSLHVSHSPKSPALSRCIFSGSEYYDESLYDPPWKQNTADKDEMVMDKIKEMERRLKGTPHLSRERIITALEKRLANHEKGEDLDGWTPPADAVPGNSVYDADDPPDTSWRGGGSLEGLEPFDEGYFTRQGQPAALRAPTAGLIAAASSAAADPSDGGPLSAGLVVAIAVSGLILFTILLVGALLVLRGYWRHRRIAGGRIGRIGLERKRGGGRGG